MNNDLFTFALSGEECLIYKTNGFTTLELAEISQFEQKVVNSGFPFFVWVKEGSTNIGDTALVVFLDGPDSLYYIKTKFEITSFTQVTSVIGIVTGISFG